MSAEHPLLREARLRDERYAGRCASTHRSRARKRKRKRRGVMSLQRYIDASQDREALLYAVRALEPRDWPPWQRTLLYAGAGERQRSRGLAVAERLLGERRHLTLASGEVEREALSTYLRRAQGAAKAAHAAAKLAKPKAVPLTIACRKPRGKLRTSTSDEPSGGGSVTTLSSRLASESRANVRRPTNGGITMPSKTASKPSRKPASKPRKRAAAKAAPTPTAKAKATRVTGPSLMAEVLEKAGRPVHNSIIAERVIAQDQARKPAERSYNGKTPDQTISAALTTSHLKGGTFVKTQPGVFGLRSWPKAKLGKAAELPERPERKTKGAKSPGRASKRGTGPRNDAVDPTAAEHTTVIREAGEKAASAA